MSKGYRILQFSAENFKRLRVVNIKPDGNVVQITGRNGQGKSSVLDAIYATLAGKGVIQKKPIRTGATEAVVRLDLGTLKVKRTFREGKDGGSYTSTISVESVDGGKFSSPQEVLDSLVGKFSLDPMAFMEMEAEEQFNSLRQFVPDVDFDKIDRLNKADYDARTELNRQARQVRAQAEGLKIPDNLPPERVDEKALLAELGAAAETNSGIAREADARQQRARDIQLARRTAEDKRNRAAELRRAADQLENDAALIDHNAESQQVALDAAPALQAPVDVAALQAKITSAREANAILDLAARREDLIADAEIAEQKAGQLTEQIQAREAAKLKAIGEAKMPVLGLGFGDRMVLLNNEPFDQASDAEKWIAAVSIAAAMNPDLRVIRIRQGSLLDEDSMKFLERLCEEKDLQCWIERVDASGKVGVVLEDGMVKQQPASEAAE